MLLLILPLHLFSQNTIQVGSNEYSIRNGMSFNIGGNIYVLYDSSTNNFIANSFISLDECRDSTYILHSIIESQKESISLRDEKINNQKEIITLKNNQLSLRENQLEKRGKQVEILEKRSNINKGLAIGFGSLSGGLGLAVTILALTR